MTIIKNHNLGELIAMGYKPVEGEQFMRHGKIVTFVEIDPTIHTIYRSEMTKNGWVDTKIDTGNRGVIYKDENGRKMSCYPMSQLIKEVSYEINFK